MRILLYMAVTAVAAGSARADTQTRPYAGVAVEQLYDSNVYNSRGDDAVTRVSPRVGLIAERETWRIDSEYKLALHAYAGGTVDNSVNHRAALTAKLLASPRLTLGADAVLLIGDDPVLLDRPGVAIPQGGFFDITAHGGLAWRWTRRTTLSLDYNYRRSRFDLADDPDPLAFDGDEHRLDGVLAWRWTRTLILRGLVRGAHFVSFGTTTSLGEAVGGGAGLEWRFARSWRARALGGPLYFSGDDGGAAYFWGGDVTRLGDNWKIALRGYHDLYGGTSAAQAVWYETLALDGSVRLMRNLAFRGRGGVYRGGIAPDGDTNVSGVVGRAELGWLVWKGARLDVFAEQRLQDADGGLAFGNITRTVAGIRLTAVAGLDLLSLGETL